MSELVSLQASEGILTLSLQRPEARNALSLEVIDALEAAVARVAADTTARVLVLRGEGKAFCSGLDFPSFTKQPMRMVRGFLKDRSALQATWQVRKEFFGNHRPASTSLMVADVEAEGALMSFEVVAMLD